MDLKSAIKETIKVVPKVTAKNRATETLAYLRFRPATQHNAAQIYGSDGGRFYTAWVDCDLPPALVNAELLGKAIKDPHELRIQNHGYGDFDLCAGDQRYKFKSADCDFPNLPEIPDFEDFEDAPKWPIPAVLHAAANPRDDPQLAVVRFTKRFVEAMDHNRVARVWMAEDWEAIVQANMFAQVPKGSVKWHFTDTHCFFLFAGEVLRIAPKRFGEYPDTEAVIPAQHTGPFVLIQVDPLLVAIKQGTAISELSLVHLLFSPNQLKIRAWIEGTVGKVYEATLPILHGSGHEGQMLVGGKPFYQALKVVRTPNVLLGHGEGSAPLRIESGPYVACLWQMIY